MLMQIYEFGGSYSHELSLACKSAETDALGGVAEWLKAHAWKACLRETVTWVRIPLPPPMSVSQMFASVRKDK